MISVLEKPRLVKTETKCWKCKSMIPVIAIATSKLVDENNLKWESPCFLTYVTYMPEALLSKIKEQCPNYDFDFSHMADEAYYANHCRNCNALQGDFFLYAEPDGVFFFALYEEEDMSKYEVIVLDVSIPFEVDGCYGMNLNDIYWQKLGSNDNQN
jgi:hypothetical protein